MLLVLFLMAFVVGPALFLALFTALGHVKRRVWPLALIASLLMIASLALRNEASLTLSADRALLFASLVLIWLAWILVLVLVVRALCRTFPQPKARRWARAFGAMGTTVPWFGFAAAQMMAE
jgi:hypothetical protein